MNRRLCVALGLVASILAPARAPAGPLVREVLEVPTRDGDTIRVETLRDTAFDPQPVLLTLSPYNQGADPVGAQPRNDIFSNRYVPRGIARAWGDVLGTRGSSGCWDYGGTAEQRSGVDLVNDLALLPWSSGRVGMIGISYDGTTPLQVATAGEDAPGLAAIVAMAGVASWYDYDYSRGARNFSGFGVSALFDAEYSRPPPPLLPDGPNQKALIDGVRDCDIADHSLRSYTDTPRYDDWWRERNSTARASAVRVPTALVHGWADENVQTGQSIGFWEALEASKNAAPRFLYMHPGAHEIPGGDRWFGFLDRFLSEALLARTPSFTGIPRVWSVAAGLPLDSTGDEWPPAGTTPDTFHLGLGGVLDPEPRQDAPASFQALARDSNASAIRYQTAPVGEYTRLTGTATADLWLSVSEAREQFVAELFETPGTGPRHRITTSYLDLRYIGGLEEPRDLAPGSPFRVHLAFQPRDYYLTPGSRLELRLSGYDGGQLYPPRGSTVTVHHGAGGMASTLTVPLAPV